VRLTLFEVGSKSPKSVANENGDQQKDENLPEIPNKDKKYRENLKKRLGEDYNRIRREKDNARKQKQRDTIKAK